MKFSVLISIYFKENPEYFNSAMKSIWTHQTLKPDEILLVEDGPLTEALYEAISYWQNDIGDALKVIKLENNMGLGDALNRGLLSCRNELVARMDTDDIARPDRFEKQISYMLQNPLCDVVGGWIEEFELDTHEAMLCRKTPLQHQEIVNFAKKRNAMNHVSVMFKKDKVQNAGGYKTVVGFEDYDLWTRMIMQGSQFENLPNVFVSVRAGSGLLFRRRGLNYAIAEFCFQKSLFQYGFLNLFEFLRNVILRFPARIAPTCILRFIYKHLRE